MVPNDGSIDGSDRPRPGHSQNHSTDFSVSMQKPPRNSPFTEARSNVSQPRSLSRDSGRSY